MDDKSLGKLLAVLRKRKGLSQKSAAEALYVSTSTVCKWEKGDRTPDLATLRRLMELYDCTFADFYNPSETLKRLEASDTQQKEVAAGTETKEIPMLKRSEPVEILPVLENQLDYSLLEKRGSRNRVIITAVLAVFLVCVTAYVLMLAQNQLPKTEIREIFENYAVDEWYGEVYQIACIVDEEPTQEWLMEQLGEFEMMYKENQGQSSETDVVKVVFYVGEVDLYEENPLSCSYFFYSN